MKKKLVTRINISLKPDVLKLLDEFAKQLGTTRSGCITQVLTLPGALESNVLLRRAVAMIVTDMKKIR